MATNICPNWLKFGRIVFPFCACDGWNFGQNHSFTFLSHHFHFCFKSHNCYNCVSVKIEIWTSWLDIYWRMSQGKNVCRISLLSSGWWIYFILSRLFDFSRQLNILDGDNIYSIMASEENIEHLMDMLETAIKVSAKFLTSWHFHQLSRQSVPALA